MNPCHWGLRRRWLSFVVFALLMSPGAGSGHEGNLFDNRPDRVLHSAEGAFDLAGRYENGESLPKDYRRAHELYCKAARGGDARAFLGLAWLYLNARGVPRDDNAAAFWLRKAAERQIPQAQNLLHLLAGVAPADRGCGAPANNLLVAAPVAPSRPAAAPVTIGQAIENASQDAGLSARLVSAIASVESAFNSAAVSPKGAVGVMQLMPATAQRFQVIDRFDYRDNIRGGAAYIRVLLARFGGNLDLTLAAYNAGEGAVAAYGGVPPFRETQVFVRLVKERCGCAGVAASGVTTTAAR